MRLAWLLVTLIGCSVSSEEVGEVDEALIACRAHAASSCEALGYGDNETCILVFAKVCSAEDEELAREACVEMEGLPADADCCLKWR